MATIFSIEVWGNIFSNLPFEKLLLISQECSTFHAAAVPHIFSSVTCSPSTTFYDSDTIDSISDRSATLSVSHEPEGILQFFHECEHLCCHVRELVFTGFQFEWYIPE